jgi:hypothetical protein
MQMRQRMNKAGLAALAALALTTAAVTAKADANPANDSGSFTVRITPNVDLGVVVDTTGSNWTGSANLDVTSDLATDTRLTTPIGIAMAGNFGNQELTLSGVALNTCQLDTDELDAQDEMRLYAMFGKFGFAASPAVVDFNGVGNLITGATTRAGQPQADEGGDTNHTYELATGNGEYDDVDGMNASQTRKLWLRARTPSTTTTGDEAAFTVTVTAVTGVGL